MPFVEKQPEMFIIKQMITLQIWSLRGLYTYSSMMQEDFLQWVLFTEAESQDKH